jgi:signal transduction histidine kinase
LGLSLVKSVVEAHDGKISFKSVEGEGSTFYIDLPAAEGEREAV